MKYPLIAAIVIAVVVAVFYFVPGLNPWGGSKEESKIVPSGPVQSTSTEITPTSTQNAQLGKKGVIEGTARVAVGAVVKFTSVRISLADAKTNKQVANTNLSANGYYKFVVEPGEYILDIASWSATSKQLPQRVYVGPGETISLNFQIK